jgi:nicotinamide mononucleotide transporter PnuC
MKLQNPFKNLTKMEWGIWIFSLVAVLVSFFLNTQKDAVTLISCLIGVTALIFISKGDPIGQILAVVFALGYSVASYTQKYYGEMITYLGMSTPMSIAAMVAWFKNPHKAGENEVRVGKMIAKKWVFLCVSAVAVTVAFYFILRTLNTANLIVSTLSVTTSFLASWLSYLRSPYYALAYATNDVVLILLWGTELIKDPSVLPTLICFVIFLANDLYGFINWKRMMNEQKDGR